MGLVAITPGAGYVPIWASIIIGALVSPICYFFVDVVKPKFGYDDALDVFAKPCSIVFISQTKG